MIEITNSRSVVDVEYNKKKKKAKKKKKRGCIDEMRLV